MRLTPCNSHTRLKAIVQMDLTYNTENTESCNRWKFTETKSRLKQHYHEFLITTAFNWSKPHESKPSYHGWNHRAWCIFFYSSFDILVHISKGKKTALKWTCCFKVYVVPFMSIYILKITDRRMSKLPTNAVFGLTWLWFTNFPKNPAYF